MSFTRLTDMAFRAYGGSGIAKLMTEDEIFS